MSIIDTGPSGKQCMFYCGDERCDCEKAPRYRHLRTGTMEEFSIGWKREYTIPKDKLALLAGRVVYKNDDVFAIFESVVGRPIEAGEHDELFERMDKEYGIFKCLECDTWLPIDRRGMNGHINVCKVCNEEESNALEPPADSA